MIVRRSILALSVVIMLTTGAALAEPLRCSVCGKKIEGAHITDDRGRVYCSEKCYESTLPVCSVCGKRLKGKYLTRNGKRYCSPECMKKDLPRCAVCGKPIEGKFFKEDGKFYCSEKCYVSTLPPCSICGARTRELTIINRRVFCPRCAGLPRCRECGLPFGKGVSLSDGRRLCAECAAAAVFNVEDAARYYNEARDFLKKLTGRDFDDPPEMELVDFNILGQLWGAALGPDSPLRGFYRISQAVSQLTGPKGEVLERKKEIKERKVFLLYGQRRENFTAAAVHELTHDLIALGYPRLTESPQWCREGICQYTAAIYCRRKGLDKFLELIEKNPFPDYGDGYRYFRSRFGEDGWPRVERWMRAVEVGKLPKAPPAK